MTHINGYMPMRNDDYRHEIEHWAHYLPPASLSKIQWSACALTRGRSWLLSPRGEKTSLVRT